MLATKKSFVTITKYDLSLILNSTCSTRSKLLCQSMKTLIGRLK